MEGIYEKVGRRVSNVLQNVEERMEKEYPDKQEQERKRLEAKLRRMLNRRNDLPPWWE